MDNIFTLNKYDDENSEQHINIDDLYEKKRERDMAQLKLFNKMLIRVHNRIQTTSRQRNAEKICWFIVPEIMLGVPIYDQGSCIGYLMDKLKQDGFRVQYFHPNTLMITWNHWVPNYVIEEIKTKTGRIYDNQGNDLTPTPDIDYTTNQKYNIGPQEPSSVSNEITNIVYKSGEGVFQRSRKQASSSSATKRENNKKYTPIDTYKPSGSMVYDETFLFNMNKIKK